MEKVIVCPHCGTENFGTKIKCHMCNKILSATPAESSDAGTTGRPVGLPTGKMRSTELAVETKGALVTEITESVRSFAQGIRLSGMVNIFVPHSTAGVAIIETGSGSEKDLAKLIDTVLPSGDDYSHKHGPAGHGRDHLIPAFLAASISIPSDEGRIYLGQWQSIVLVDTNSENNTRRVRLSFVPGQMPEST